MSTTDIRAAFEALITNGPLSYLTAQRMDNGEYISRRTRAAWTAYQAATEAAKATGTAGEVEHIHSPSEQADIGKRIRRVAKAAGYEPDGTDEFYYAAAFAILGRAADALEAAARQPAPVELSYLQLLAIADDSEAHEALQGFSEDPTQDNGVCVVRAILKAATNRSQP